MKFYQLALGILATWRVTHLFQAEDGPWDIVVRLRRRLGDSVLGRLMDCFYCLSIWISAPFAWWLGETWGERFLLWLSFSGGASVLQQITNRQIEVPPAAFVEESPGDEKEEHGMLRSEKKRGHTETDSGTADR